MLRPVVNKLRYDVCTGKRIISKAVPVYEYLDGWKEDISKCRSYSELPENARKYIEYIEKNVGCKIKYISVGAERDALIEK